MSPPPKKNWKSQQFQIKVNKNGQDPALTNKVLSQHTYNGDDAMTEHYLLRKWCENHQTLEGAVSA